MQLELNHKFTYLDFGTTGDEKTIKAYVKK